MRCNTPSRQQPYIHHIHMDRFSLVSYMCTMQHVWRNGLNWNECFAQIDMHPCSKREVKNIERIQMFNTTIKDWIWYSTAAIHLHTDTESITKIFVWKEKMYYAFMWPVPSYLNPCVCVFFKQWLLFYIAIFQNRLSPPNELSNFTLCTYTKIGP